MIHYFSSTQSAILPPLSGTAGALSTILKTCLVTGAGAFNVQALTVAGGVATATFAAAHGFIIDSVVALAGASPGALNGVVRVLGVPSSTSLTFVTSAPDGVASGTITIKMAPADWEELYSGTSLSVLRPTAFGAFGGCLRIDDTDGKNARVCGYESMSDVSTGVGPAPTPAQFSGGLYWGKSRTADAAARPWIVVADERGAHVMLAPGTAGNFCSYYVGDLDPDVVDDAWAWLLTGSIDAGAADAGYRDPGCVGLSDRAAPAGGLFLMRGATGVSGAVSVSRLTGAGHNGDTGQCLSGASGYSPPAVATGVIQLTEVEVADSSGRRGVVPGIFHLRNKVSVAAPVVVDGTDDMLGRRLLLVPTGWQVGEFGAGTMAFDITGPWRRRS